MSESGDEPYEDDDVAIEFPVEFVVPGTPVSFQSSKTKTKDAWKAEILTYARTVVPKYKWASSEELSITIYDFPKDLPQGDVDNIVKLIQDALCPKIIVDDRTIKRVVAQRFLPKDIDKYAELPELVARAISLGDAPFVFIRLHDEPLGDAM